MAVGFGVSFPFLMAVFFLLGHGLIALTLLDVKKGWALAKFTIAVNDGAVAILTKYLFEKIFFNTQQDLSDIKEWKEAAQLATELVGFEVTA